MSIAHRVVASVVAVNGGDPAAGIHRDRLRQMTAGLYAGRGANGALFGFRYTWMIKVGEMRFLTADGRRRLGI